jgi:hypothetical protein
MYINYSNKQQTDAIFVVSLFFRTTLSSDNKFLPMKKLLFTLAFLSATAATYAQTINAGLMAGLNLADQIHVNSRDFGSSMHVGIKVGGILDIAYQSFAIEPGLFFTQKGENDQSRYSNLNPLNGGGYVPSKTTLDYIEIPVNFLYKSKVGPGANLHFGGGPYIAYGFSESISINGGSDPNHNFTFKKGDYGVNLLAGVTITNLLIDAGYGLGVRNIDLNGSSAHNSVISLSVGYLF